VSELNNAKELVEREFIATQTRNTIIVNDGSNIAEIPGYPYSFEAKGSNILVSVDIFKSGYECRECKGVGRIKSRCPCEETDRPGHKYSQDQINEFLHVLTYDVAMARADLPCSECKGDYAAHRVDAVCPVCQGKSTLLHIPDQSKILPTTGVIVSMGPCVNKELGYKLHQRVLFGAYVGVMIPTKAPGVVFKVLRDIEILCTISGGEDMAAFDFITIDKD
jgi:hypothetical protein